jgi:hypothetical protein
MGGPHAPGDLKEGCHTQAWLSVSDDTTACVSGKYFHHMRQQAPDPIAFDENRQDRLMEICTQLSGISLQY